MRLRRCAPAFAILLLCVLHLQASTHSVPTDTWQQGGVLSTARTGATATLMADGRILIVGGKDGSGNALATAEVFNPDGTTAPVLSMLIPRYGHSAILLYDGSVLVAGGHTSGSGVVNSAELFDPVANTWRLVPNTMADSRADFTLSQLIDGNVLVVGGDNGSGPVSSVEKFDLLTGVFKYKSSLITARTAHTASVLKDGRVLVTGGSAVAPDGSRIALTSTEIYDPNLTFISAGPTLNVRRYAHSATTLIDGTVLLAGGNNGSADLASMELYDPVANTISLSSASLVTPRSGHVALLLPNNNSVLIAGGTSSGADLSSTELYQSWNSAMLANPPMSAARLGAAGSALQADGAALIAGGSNLGTTELYGFAAVKTDKLDYAPGTPVQITGSGWNPGETVTLTLVESPNIDQHPAMTATADPLGNISNSDFVPDGHDVYVRFYLTAVGTQSQAQTTFTDAPKVDTTAAITTHTPNPSVVGQSVTFGVSVTATGSTVNEGCLQIFDNGAALPGTAPVSSGAGSIAVQFTSAGTHSNVQVKYIDSGSCATKGNNFNDSNPSTAVSQTVNKATSSTSVVTSGSPSLLGQSVTFTATLSAVSPGIGTPTGSVSFYDGASGATCSALGSSALLGAPAASAGSASLSISALSLGSHTILACYAGDSNFNGNSGASVSETINKVTPTINWSNPAAITYGTALGSTQLNSTATYLSGGTPVTVPGTFTYTPAAGTVLNAGNSQTLSVHFVPTDTASFNTPADKTVSINVLAKSVTANITASNKVYDGTTTVTFTCSLSGVLAADTASVTCTGGSASFASAAVGTGITVTATGLTLSGSGASNYTLSSSSSTTTANITPKNLTITGVTANDKVYDGTTTATLNVSGATLQGIIGSDHVNLQTGSAVGSFADKNVGTGKAVTASGFGISGPESSNYTLSQPTGLAANITPKPITVTGVTANDRVYDGTSAATLNTSSASLVGIVAGDTVTLGTSGATGTFGDKNAGNGKAVTVSGLTISGSSSGNYSLSQPTTTASITPKPLTVTGVSANNKTYDGTASASLNTATAALVGVVSGDTVTLGTSGATGTFTDKNVGSNKPVTVAGLTIAGVDAGNYSLSQPTATASITPKPLTVTGISANNKTYDGSTSASLNTATASLVGVVSGDTVTLGMSTATGTFADKNVDNNKPVTVAGLTITGIDAGNYSLSQPTATASITPKLLTVSGITTSDKVYDGTTVATLNLASGSLQGLIAGDVVTLSTSAASGIFADKNVGSTKAVSISGLTITGTDAGNYSLSQPTTSASITPKPLTVTGVSANNKTYDGSTSTSLNTATASLVGVVSGDTVTLGTSGAAGTFTDKNVGSNKPVTVAGLAIAGIDSSNYSLSQPTAAASITPKPLTVTGVTANDKVYDGTSSAILNTGSASLTGTVSGDTVTLGMSGATGTFADKNVGNNKPVAVAGLIIAGVDSGNYSLSQPTATASITPKLITVAGITANNKTYDGTAAATLNLGSVSLQGTVSGDTVSPITTAATGSFADKNVGTAKTVTIAGVALNGSDAPNYSLTQPTATADVTSKSLTPTVAVQNKIYDGTASGTVASQGLTGVIGQDVVSLVAGSATFSDKNVGIGKAVTVNGLNLSGSDAGNYSVSNLATTAADITPRALHVTATGSPKTYDGNTVAVVTLHDDRVGGDVFADSNTSATFIDKNVGTGKAISVTGISISGSDAANYGPVNSTATASADITARVLTVSAIGANKTYDGNTTATVQLSDDRLAGDSLADSYGSATFDSKNVGSGKTVSVSGISVSGSDAGNYNLANTTASTTANISARHVTVTATGVDKTYDGTTTDTVTLSDDRLAGDTLIDSYSSASFSDKNVGSGKTVTVTGIAISGADAANYSANPNTATTASLSPRKLTVIAAGVAKVYDGTTLASVTLSDDRVSGDQFTDADASATFSDKNVGTAKIVSVTGITISGIDAGNYSPVNATPTTTAEITPRSLTVSAISANRPYDGTTSASVTLTDNRVQGDALIDAFAGATFSDRNAGIAKTVTVTGISISGVDVGNYVLGNTTASTTADITARAIEVTATSDSKTYDGITTSSKSPLITFGSLAEGDNATYTQVFDSKNAGTRLLLPSTVIADGNNGHNYSVVFHNANGTISPLTIAGSITVSDRTYDGTISATIATRTLSGVLANDVVSYMGGTATFSDSNAGVGKTVTAVGLYLAGTDAGNYTGSSTATTTATIFKANQQISWSTPAPIVFGTSLGNTQLNSTATGVQGGTAPGALTYTPAAGTILGVGTHQLRVDAASTINYNAATTTVSINVSYSTGACLGDLGHSILQPVNVDGSSTFKQGSTVPAKFRVCDVAGHSIGTAGVVTSFNLVQTISGTVSATVEEAVISTTPDSSFRWDSTSQQWIFNVSTKPLSAQTTYVYSIGLNDGSTIFFRYGLPK